MFTIPVLLVAVGLGIVAFQAVPVRYQSSATMILTAPTSGGSQQQAEDEEAEDTEYNPLLQFNESLQTTAALLILSANTEDVKKRMGAPTAGDTRLQVDDGRSNTDLLAATQTGPFIYITAEAPTPEKAASVVAAVRTFVRGDLRRLQDSLKAPGRTYISVSDVSTDPPKTVQKTRLAATVGVPAGVVVAALLIAFPFARRRPPEAERPVPASYPVPPQRTLPGAAEPVEHRARPGLPAAEISHDDYGDADGDEDGELPLLGAPDGREDTVVFGAIGSDDEITRPV
ncbi:hypothetical protein GCM10022221_09250 [Actinocorallia aurea]